MIEKRTQKKLIADNISLIGLTEKEAMNPNVVCFYDNTSSTASYVISDRSTRRAAIIDPVLDLDPVSWRVSSGNAQKIADYVTKESLTVDWILETHIHADHVTAAAWLKNLVGGKTGMGVGIKDVKRLVGELFNVLDQTTSEETEYDVLFSDGAEFAVGEILGYVIATPGHTPTCVTYVIGDTCFVGDTLFMPDSGTARCDFPGGDATEMYSSLQRILKLPENTRLFVCHDYGAGGKRDFAWESSVADQRDNNIHVGGGTLEHDYVQMRKARDATLTLPKLFLPAIQINARAGSLPDPEPNGTSYIKIPLNTF